MASGFSASTLKSLRSGSEDNSAFAIKSRFDYAAHDPEQVFQRRHTTEREIGSSILMPAVQTVERMILYQDLFSQASYRLQGRMDQANLLANEGKKAKSFSAALYRGFNDVAFKTYGAEFLRGSSVGYNEIQDYRLIYNVIDDIQALAKTAESLDPSPQSISQTLQRAINSDVHTLLSNPAHADRLLTEYGQGKLTLTSQNLNTVESTLKAMLTIKKAAPNTTAEKVTATSEPYDLSMLPEKQKITNFTEAQILLGVLPVLLKDGAIPLNTEIYTPLDPHGIGPKNATKLAKNIQEIFKSNGLAINIANDGSVPIADAPRGAIIKSEHGVLRALKKQELLSIANQIQDAVIQDPDIAQGQLNRFVKNNYHSIQNTIAHHDDGSTYLENKPVSKPVQPAVFNSDRWSQHVASPMFYSKPSEKATEAQPNILQRLNASWRNATREEAVHEVNKLYWRQFHTFLWNFPVVAVKNYLLFNVSSLLDKSGMGGAKASKATASIQETLAHSHMMPFWKRNLLSNMWVLAATPVVKSHFVVVGREIIKSNNQLAGDVLTKFEPQLENIIQQSINQRPDLEASLEALWHPQSDNMQRGIEEHLEELQTKRATWEQAFNPVYVHQFHTRPANTVGEALTAIAYIQVLMQESHKSMRSLEFIDPDGVVVNANQIISITSFALEQAQAQGLNGNQPVSDAQLIRYANALTEKLCTTLSQEKIQLAVNGTHHTEYQDLAERKIQTSIRPSKDVPKPDNEVLPKVDESLTKPWSNRIATPDESAITAAWKQAKRQEASHEGKLLFRRTLFKRIAFLLPSYTENLLLGHKNSIDNVAGTLWELASYPFAYGPGIVFTKEFSKFSQRQAVVQSEYVQDLLKAAGISAWHNSKDLLEEAQHATNNPFLEAAAASEAYHNLSVILGKEQHDPKENSLLQHFQHEYGHAILQRAQNQLNGKIQTQTQHDLTSRLQHIAAAPVNDIAEARLALSTVYSFLNSATKQVDTLLFVPKARQLLDRKQLAAVSNYLRAQVEDAGFIMHTPAKDQPAVLMKHSGNQLVPLDDKDVIHLANVALGELRKVVGTGKLSSMLIEHGNEGLQEQINGELYANTSQLHTDTSFVAKEALKKSSNTYSSTKRAEIYQPKHRGKADWQSAITKSEKTAQLSLG